MPRSSEPYLLIIRAGPYWGLDPLEHFAEVFGRSFEGELCTWGQATVVVNIGRFQIRRYGLSDYASVAERVRYAFKVIGRALRARWIRKRRVVIIAYDPFKSGLMGLIGKWLTGARLICEVNGLYGNEDTFIDIEDPEARRRKQRRMLRLGSFVLRRADLIKLLFPGQLDGFSVREDRPLRDHFFDMVNEEWFPVAENPPGKRLLFVGHPYLLKGVDLLLEAWARVRADWPDWTLVIIGWLIEDGARARSAPVEGVQFMGPQRHEKISHWMGEARALVLPSRSEGMARVLIEAAFRGRARLGSRLGGIRYCIEDEVDGLLFEPGSADALEACLRRFLGDTELQERLGANALNRARRDFTSERYLRHYERAINTVMGSQR